MNETLHANIFFFITSVAVLAITAALLIVLWYVIAILREVRKITLRVRKASDNLEKDIDYLRQEIKNGGEKVLTIVNTFVGFAMGRFVKPTKRPTSRKRVVDETENIESV